MAKKGRDKKIHILSELGRLKDILSPQPDDHELPILTDRVEPKSADSTLITSAQTLTEETVATTEVPETAETTEAVEVEAETTDAEQLLQIDQLTDAILEDCLPHIKQSIRQHLKQAFKSH